jgi:hypothetical protein
MPATVCPWLDPGSLDEPDGSGPERGMPQPFNALNQE